jgi:hypothetical protein
MYNPIEITGYERINCNFAWRMMKISSFFSVKSVLSLRWAPHSWLIGISNLDASRSLGGTDLPGVAILNSKSGRNARGHQVYVHSNISFYI